ncbi:MAG: hypothetical protein ACK4YO_02740, partial [Candidatus Altarchaeaceae archaeon]
YSLNVTVVVYDMCCNFYVWNKILNITERGAGAGAPPEIECPKCKEEERTWRGAAGGGGYIARVITPTESITGLPLAGKGEMINATYGWKLEGGNSTLMVFNITELREGEPFKVKVVNVTERIVNVTYEIRREILENGSIVEKIIKINETIIKPRTEVPVANANVEYVGQRAVTNADGIAEIPKAVKGINDIRAWKGEAEAFYPTITPKLVIPKEEKKILHVEMIEKDIEKGIYEFVVKDKDGNLAINTELKLRLPTNQTITIKTDDKGRFVLNKSILEKEGLLYVDEQQYDKYNVTSNVFSIEWKHPVEVWWWGLLILVIILLIYLLILLRRGGVTIVKERKNGRIIITVKNNTNRDINGVVIEDIIPLGLQVKPITENIQQIGDKLILGCGTLKRGEKAVMEYEILSVEGIKGKGVEGLPEAKVSWIGGEKYSKK